MRQAGTVAVMCPSMSLAASVIFNVILGGSPVFQLPAIWAGTVIKNFPMAFFLEYVWRNGIYSICIRTYFQK